ncbi:MAG TPA: beta-galactosidase [Tessaracoccus flavescens]|uniref:Beta-galactosidase n=1 Tax=Tessaracoccus flavescens TaxID=399497 RepID=A0A921EN58_9ACTN|nr:beta-galactosidase [Tessaracoccus flavescens]
MTLHYGGDYNPEQWPTEVWAEDYAAFDEAHIDTVTLGVFAWAYTQPEEDRYDFTILDAIVERAVEEGRRIVLGTGTAALPPWLAHQHPEVTRTDFEGRRHLYGQRHNPCPNSPVYRRLSAALAGKVAERYGSNDNLIAWHIGNEYGGQDGACFCENCAAAFRVWLRERYGSLDRLNDAWNTMFWSHRYSDWEQIVPPNALTEHWRGPRYTAFPVITLDYQRFISDSMLANYRDELAAIREFDPETPATTNFMGLFRHLDYHRWAERLDFVSWDNYPRGMRDEARMALAHDLMRGLKGGQPFWVMEQTPTITASRDVNPVKRPGVVGLWSWQGIAHGADAMLYFQMRQSRGACEKYHGAVLDHSGRTDTRTFREVAALGAELSSSGEHIVGARTPARVALIFDWQSWWLTELTDGLNRHVDYSDVVLRHYKAAWRLGAQVDVIAAESDLSGYDVVLAPCLHMLRDDIVERLEAVVARGGAVVTGFYSGRADVNTNAFTRGDYGPLDHLTGVRVEETDSLEPGTALRLSGADGALQGELVAEILTCLNAEPVVVYGQEFYAGTAAVSRRVDGEGECYYIATLLDEAGYDEVIGGVLRRRGLAGPYADFPEVEFCLRDTATESIHFILNHSDDSQSVPAPSEGTDLLTGCPVQGGDSVTLAPKQVMVVSVPKQAEGKNEQ